MKFLFNKVFEKSSNPSGINSIFLIDMLPTPILVSG